LGHGTQDASMLGAIGNNDTAMVGEAWGTGMLSIRIFDSNGQAPETTVQTGIDALEQIMSTFGSQAPVGVIDMDVVFPAPTPGLETSIQQAAARGLVTVSPTGDECLNAADYPARYRTNGQIAVSGSDQLDEPMFFRAIAPTAAGRWLRRARILRQYNRAVHSASILAVLRHRILLLPPLRACLCTCAR